MKILILDPTSPEFNRGSFCYQPYLLYSYFAGETGCEVEIWEDFTATQINDIPEDAVVFVALWSYPQIDLCKVIYRFSPARNIRFFGYTPLIKQEGLPLHIMGEQQIGRGIYSYPAYLVIGKFKHILLSDCDMHMKKYEGKVYPLFTSYGCPRSCEFCPSSVNCNHKIVSLPVYKTVHALKFMYGAGIKNIHFTDEDFFLNPRRAFDILSEANRIGDFNFIALSHLHSLTIFVDLYGPLMLSTLGVRVVELGFETADPNLTKSMKKHNSIENYVDIYERVKNYTNIFWLCMTFFPGETISTLNATGEFLSKYGSKPEDLYGRIVTNSTEGGLGQFFQPYPGTPGYVDLPSRGVQIEDRPIRLLPSFLPDSFMHDEIRLIMPSIADLEKLDFWCKVYNLPIERQDLGCLDGLQVKQAIGLIKSTHKCSVGVAAIFIAILARLRIIRGE